MTTFHKINQPIYSVIANYATAEDGSITAKYVLGVSEENVDTDFMPLISEYKYIAPEAAETLAAQPLTADDIGKTPGEIMLDRIYTYLQSTGQIMV